MKQVNKTAKNIDDSYTQTLEEAMDNEDLHIDTYADENEPKQKLENKVEDKALNDYVKEQAESEVDVALNLEAESKEGR